MLRMIILHAAERQAYEAPPDVKRLATLALPYFWGMRGSYCGSVAIRRPGCMKTPGPVGEAIRLL